MVRMHYQPGQAIVEQGDVGSRFFLIVAGKVEVVRAGILGNHHQALAVGVPARVVVAL